MCCYEEHIANVTFAVCNTDSKVLANSPIPTIIMLGDSGLGAGANPELGKSEALKSKDIFVRMLKMAISPLIYHMVFAE